MTMNKLFLLVREPESAEECEVLEVGCTTSRLAIDLSTLESGKLTPELTRFLLGEYPMGVFVEGFGSEDYNEGVFREQTIPLLH